MHWPTSFELDAVVEAAVKKTGGLTDFGDPHYQEGLTTLLESVRQDARLNLIGKLGMREMVSIHLANRLHLVDFLQKNPQVRQQPLSSPVIILGLPRTGTTLLHRLMSMDPANYGPPLWHLLRPFETGVPEALSKKLDFELLARKWMYPDLDKKHFTRADTPEECVVLFGMTFWSQMFWTFAPVYRYMDWYLEHDRLRAYQEYAHMLRMLQAAFPTQRLVMKAPAHVGSVKEILETVPGVKIIHTHRDAVTAMSSFMSLQYTYHRRVTHAYDRKQAAIYDLRIWQKELERGLAARNGQNASLYDLHYDTFTADPVAAVKDIYHAFGLPWSDELENQMRQYVRENPKNKYGTHTYAPDEYGWTQEQIRRQFAGYTEVLNAVAGG